MADFKAVSQNVMHKSVMTTDAIYSGLIESDVAERIAALGVDPSNEEILDALAAALFKRQIGAS